MKALELGGCLFSSFLLHLSGNKCNLSGDSHYWAVQVGLTPLTFAWHRLSPLAVLLPVHTFFTMEGGDSKFMNFTLPALKAFLEACSQNVCGNKQ